MMNSASTEKAAALASGQNGIVIQPLIIDARHKVSASKYYSCRFPVCDCAATQRGERLGRGGYMLSPPSGRCCLGGEGCQAGAVVVPAGAGLVASAPCGPAELEGEAGEAD